MGMALDLTLRLHTGGARGLPELFRVLWEELDHGARHVTEADVRNAAITVVGPRGGTRAAHELDAFFDRYVNGTDELPLPALLRRAGLTVREQADWEGEEVDTLRGARARAWTGISLNPDRTTIRNVVPGSPAWRAGLTFGDELVALAGARVTAATFGKRVGDLRPGDEASVSYFRRDELHRRRLVLAEKPERKLSVAPDPKAQGTARAVREGWLGVWRVRGAHGGTLASMDTAQIVTRHGLLDPAFVAPRNDARRDRRIVVGGLAVAVAASVAGVALSSPPRFAVGAPSTARAAAELGMSTSRSATCRTFLPSGTQRTFVISGFLPRPRDGGSPNWGPPPSGSPRRCTRPSGRDATDVDFANVFLRTGFNIGIASSYESKPFVVNWKTGDIQGPSF